MRSTSPVGAVAVRAEQQRNMKVRFSAAHLKCDFDERIQALDTLRGKIIRCRERKPVDPFREAMVFRQKLGAAAVGIGSTRGQLPPGPRQVAVLEAHGNRGSGLAAYSIQNVR